MLQRTRNSAPLNVSAVDRSVTALAKKTASAAPSLGHGQLDEHHFDLPMGKVWSLRVLFDRGVVYARCAKIVEEQAGGKSLCALT